MDIGGVTEAALVERILAAIDEDCPGLCAFERDGEIVFHKITRVADLHIDVKNPAEPFALENIGILCHSCNSAKKDEPWASFMFRRRAALQAWRDAIRNPAYRRSEQLMLPIPP